MWKQRVNGKPKKSNAKESIKVKGRKPWLDATKVDKQDELYCIH